MSERRRPITGIGHIAVNTANLARFRRFYEELLGLPVWLVTRMDHPPVLRHALFGVTDGLALHAFEVPGYDPTGHGIGDEIGERGRIDHLALTVADEATLRALATRLVAAGASDGVVFPLGPFLGVHLRDPDGMALEINCPNPGWEPGTDRGAVEEVGTPDWAQRARAAARGTGAARLV